jgi:hypothetical protein
MSEGEDSNAAWQQVSGEDRAQPDTPDLRGIRDARDLLRSATGDQGKTENKSFRSV